MSDDATEPWRESLVRSLDAHELHRAVRVATHAFLREVAHSDPVLADRLAAPLIPETLC